MAYDRSIASETCTYMTDQRTDQETEWVIGKFHFRYSMCKIPGPSGWYLQDYEFCLKGSFIYKEMNYMEQNQ